VQDMLSVFYFLRNKIDTENLTKGDEIFVDLFFDDENYKFKTVFLGWAKLFKAIHLYNYNFLKLLQVIS